MEIFSCEAGTATARNRYRSKRNYESLSGFSAAALPHPHPEPHPPPPAEVIDLRLFRPRKKRTPMARSTKTVTTNFCISGLYYRRTPRNKSHPRRNFSRCAAEISLYCGILREAPGTGARS